MPTASLCFEKCVLLPRGKSQTQFKIQSKAFNLKKRKKKTKTKNTQQMKTKQNIKEAPVAKLLIRKELEIRRLLWGNVKIGLAPQQQEVQATEGVKH